MWPALSPLKKSKNLKDSIALIVATGLGSGLLRPAPGTWGSAAALLFIAVLDHLGTAPWMLVLIWTALLILGSWAAGHFDEFQGSGDNGRIVIDEWLGMAVTTAIFERTWLTLIIGFFVFRFFDVLKLYPVRSIDRWSKKLAQNQRPTVLRGFGVIADDLVAGLQAALVLYGIELLFFS